MEHDDARGAAATGIEVSPAARDLTREAAAATHPAPPAPPFPAVDADGPGRASATPPAGPTDLADLPGAGPGLIWLLQRAGVRSLEDLAALGADALRPRLGLAGQLIDLDAWIGFAAASRSGPAGTAAGARTGSGAE